MPLRPVVPRVQSLAQLRLTAACQRPEASPPTRALCPQGFLGPNCAQPGAVQCACLHLTDFAGGVKPHLSVASLSQMTSLDPADIFTKLRVLAAIVFSMFGAMHALGGVVHALDARSRAVLLARLKSKGVGFRQHAGTGAWTWHIRGQDPDQEARPDPLATHTALRYAPTPYGHIHHTSDAVRCGRVMVRSRRYGPCRLYERSITLPLLC